MLDDAAYYSRREVTERTLAGRCANPKIREIHLVLAGKYAQLAKRELARLSFEEAAGGRSISSQEPDRHPISARTYR